MPSKKLPASLVWIGILLILVSIASRIFTFSYLAVFGDQFFTTSGEQFCVYSIWKLIHSHPVYEWPQKEWYSLSLYNWLIYYFNGWACMLFHVDGMGIARLGRFIAAFFAAGGSLVTYLLARNLVSDLKMIPNRFVIAAGSLLLWFGPGAVADMSFTIRGDVPGIFFALCAAALFLQTLKMGSSPLLLVAAGILFYLGWSFKQSIVLTFVSCCFCCLLLQGWKRTFVLSFSFAVPVAMTLLIGGKVYRYNIVTAPSVSHLHIFNIVQFLPQDLGHGAYLFGWILFLPFLVDWKDLFKPGGKFTIPRIANFSLPARQIFVLSTACAFGLAIGLVFFTKDGSRKNLLFEGMVPLTILAIVGLHQFRDGQIPHRKFWLGYLCLIFAVSTMLPAKNLLLFRQGKMGTLPLVSTADYEEKKNFGRWLQTLPPPLFIRDHLFAQPWYSNAGKYPAIMIDECFYDQAKTDGVLEGDGIEDLVLAHYFHTLILDVQDEMIPFAKQAGYTEIPISPEFAAYQSSLYPYKVGPLKMFVHEGNTSSRF